MLGAGQVLGREKGRVWAGGEAPFKTLKYVREINWRCRGHCWKRAGRWGRGVFWGLLT